VKSSLSHCTSASKKKKLIGGEPSFQDSTTAQLDKRQALLESKEARKKEMQEHKIMHQNREFQFQVERAQKERQAKRTK
jgi:hypothetical protein